MSSSNQVAARQVFQAAVRSMGSAFHDKLWAPFASGFPLYHEHPAGTACITPPPPMSDTELQARDASLHVKADGITGHMSSSIARAVKATREIREMTRTRERDMALHPHVDHGIRLAGQ